MPAGGRQQRRELLVIGAQFTGTFVARELRRKLNVTVVDAKEYFEYTPGILRAYVRPAHWESLTFKLEPVLAKRMGVRLVVGEVMALSAEPREARVRLLADGQDQDTALAYDYCVICAGCHFNTSPPYGESLWFPTIHEAARLESAWRDLDERYLEGRRRHILAEHDRIQGLSRKKDKVLVVGAGFIGVEWATELKHFFPDLDITIIDFMRRCLGPLPLAAAEYCSAYMQKAGIQEFYQLRYTPGARQFWQKVGMPEKFDQNPKEGVFSCQGVQAANFFMPEETKSKTGPGGGGWILINMKLQVASRETCDVWGGGRVFAVGDCTFGRVFDPSTGDLEGRNPSARELLPPVPKICYPGEEQASHACRNVLRLAAAGELPSPEGQRSLLMNTWWPWGAGIMSTSLGPRDAVCVTGANSSSGAGKILLTGRTAAIHKDYIETTKCSECQNGLKGRFIWYLVHHTPINLWGRGPCFVC